MITPASVAMVMVTYADRDELCIASIEAATAAGVKFAVIVINGSSEASRERLRTFVPRAACEIQLVELPINHGSAVAFGMGIEEAERRWRSDFLWLLDDDNAPAPDCLATLLAAHRVAASAGEAIIFARRERSPLHRAVLSGGRGAFPPPGAFMYFDLLQRCARVRRTGFTAPTGLIAVPYGPYGGLLIKREIVERIGLPRADYVLYEDDTEFTARVASMGIGSFLCLDAVIRDLDENWLESGGSSGPGRLLEAHQNSRAKVFYSTRNRVHFEKERAVRDGKLPRFYMNGLLYVCFLLLNCLMHRRLGQLSVVWKGIRRGTLGELGSDMQFELSSVQQYSSDDSARGTDRG